MIQVHYIYCALYFCDYDISSTSDHQALNPESWGALLWNNWEGKVGGWSKANRLGLKYQFCHAFAVV